eukprot:170318_1
MNNNELEFAINRLKREKVELERHKRDGLVLVGVAGEPLEQNIAEWHINIKPNNGVYKDICFHLIMTFPATYPVNPPEIHMCTPIQHPNIFQDHSLCMPMFRNNVNNHPYGGWSCGYTITSILMQLQTFLSNDNPNSNLVDNNIKQILESTKKFKCKCGHSYYTPKPLIIDPQFKITYNPYDIYKHIKQIKIKNTETGSTLSIKDLKQHLYVNSSNQLQFIQGQDKKLLILIEFKYMVKLNLLRLLAMSESLQNIKNNSSEFSVSAPRQVQIYKIGSIEIDFDFVKKLKPDLNEETNNAVTIFENISENNEKFNQVKCMALYVISNQNNTQKTYFNRIIMKTIRLSRQRPPVPQFKNKTIHTIINPKTVPTIDVPLFTKPVDSTNQINQKLFETISEDNEKCITFKYQSNHLIKQNTFLGRGDRRHNCNLSDCKCLQRLKGVMSRYRTFMSDNQHKINELVENSEPDENKTNDNNASSEQLNIHNANNPSKNKEYNSQQSTNNPKQLKTKPVSDTTFDFTPNPLQIQLKSKSVTDKSLSKEMSLTTDQIVRKDENSAQQRLKQQKKHILQNAMGASANLAGIDFGLIEKVHGKDKAQKIIDEMKSEMEKIATESMNGWNEMLERHAREDKEKEEQKSKPISNSDNYIAEKTGKNIDDIYENDYHNVAALNDFHHLLFSHCDQFEDIHNGLVEHDNGHKCTLENCTMMRRSYRDRITLRDNDDKIRKLYLNMEDGYDIIQQQLLDKMHCFYYHSFDTGRRLRKSDIETVQHQLKQERKHDEIVNEIHKLNKQKQQTCLNVPELKNSLGKAGSKFSTSMDENELVSYSNGIRYFYWEYYKRVLTDYDPATKIYPIQTILNTNNEYNIATNPGYNLKDWYIHAIFSTLKDEMLNNKICRIGNMEWDILVLKAHDHLNGEHAKLINCNSLDSKRFYGINKGTVITLSHLIALMIYCNEDYLQRKFTETYR